MPRGRDPNIATRKILDAAFRLYSERNIASVSYQQIAEAAGVALPTITSKFPRKQDLVIAVATDMWTGVWSRIRDVRPDTALPDYTAAQRMEFFMDRMIELYMFRPAVMKYSANFDVYVQQENLTDDQLKSYYEAVSPLRERFRMFYQRAKEDHTVRTDVPEDRLFRATLYTMLSTAGRYASGTVWPPSTESERVEALKILKDMIMNYCRGGNTQ